ncbi:acyl carrier protein [Phytohabitans houttuyneae]|uniref:Carrier domain-containing protein n=1 Tax=Phytohabitans houttuyneae TaxID=1076126 RepID=A0A6V8KEM5_9ACTN|nr:acyl carrier protein [Phytohabitans houttuyneae]GFJ80788.1 hypothetical protein Phou_049680 [Phytohabitans houttuyneae]
MTDTPSERPGADQIAAGVTAFLHERVKVTPDPEQDLFAAGLVSSMFAMELVVHLEREHDIVIAGPDLVLDNFRSVRRMTDLVLRLREEPVASGA